MEEQIADALLQINTLQETMYAQGSNALLVIFQGMDTAGKDGAIKTMADSMNPQGVATHSFKQPTPNELRHDFLWRSTCVCPERGIVGIFNRSYYENVLIARVHPEIVLKEKLRGITSLDDITEDFWKKRYNDINAYEKMLRHNSIRMVKIFLHISYTQQRKRLLERIKNKDKNWKFSPSDMYERQWWEQYMQAYNQMIRSTSVHSARWYVVPADSKAFARYTVVSIILRELLKINPQIPTLDKDIAVQLEHYKAELLREKNVS